MSESVQLSEGALQLARAASVKESSRRLGCSPRTVSAWRGGEQLPSDRYKQLIFDAYAIQPRLWSITAGFAGLAHAADIPAVAAPAEAPSSPAKDASALELLRAQIPRLEALRAEQGLTMKARLDLEGMLLKSAAELARHTSLALTRAQVLESPYLQEMADASIAALETDWLGLCLAIDGLMGLAGGESKVAECAREFPAEYQECLRANAALTAARGARKVA